MSEVEKLSAEDQIRVASFEYWSNDAAHRLEYADRFAHAALKSLFFMNGAAIVSLLTMVGNSQVSFDKRGLFWALTWICLGLLSVLVSYFCAYFCQNLYFLSSTNDAWKAKFESLQLEHSMCGDAYKKQGNGFIYGAVIFAVLSFVFFVCGAFVGLIAIT